MIYQFITWNLFDSVPIILPLFIDSNYFTFIRYSNQWVINVRWKNLRSKMKAPYVTTRLFQKWSNLRYALGSDSPTIMATTQYSRIQVSFFFLRFFTTSKCVENATFLNTSQFKLILWRIKWTSSGRIM